MPQALFLFCNTNAFALLHPDQEPSLNRLLLFIL